jgi:hypothetical protein
VARGLARRTLLTLALIGSLAAGAAALAASGASRYTGSVKYHPTSQGKTQGTRTVGLKGSGGYGGRLAGTSRAVLVRFAAAAGIPVSEALKGGTYKVAWTMSAGRISGTALAKFKSRSAGSVCVSYSASATQFVNGAVTPPKGTFKTLGGTGRGARASISGTFAVGKTSFKVEDETEALKGSLKSAVGRARGLTAACRKLA